MPRLSVILPLGEDLSAARASVRSALAALPRDGHLVVLTGPGAEPAVDPDPRVAVHRSAGTISPQAAVNWLLEHTDSDLVARADPGDAALPWRFRMALRTLARCADVVFAPVVGAGTASRGFTFSDPSGLLPLGTDAMRLHLLLSSRVASGTLVARRHALDRVAGYRDIPMAEYDLTLRLAVHPIRMHRLAVPAVVTGGAPAPAERMERRRPETEGLLADAFRTLSTQLLGREHLRLPVLAALPLSAEELEEELTDYTTDIRRAAQSLPPHERYPLLRALRWRIAATRELHRTEMASVAW